MEESRVGEVAEMTSTLPKVMLRAMMLAMRTKPRAARVMAWSKMVSSECPDVVVYEVYIYLGTMFLAAPRAWLVTTS